MSTAPACNPPLGHYPDDPPPPPAHMPDLWLTEYWVYEREDIFNVESKLRWRIGHMTHETEDRALLWKKDMESKPWRCSAVRIVHVKGEPHDRT